MTSIKRYESDSDVAMRLNGTYLRYQGECYYTEAAGGLKVVLYRPAKREEYPGHMTVFKKVDANDPDLDISSAPLGYCNLPNYGPVYMSRPAERRQRQGVSPGNISGFDEVSRRWCRPVSRHLDLPPKCIIDMVEGEYPTLQEIVKAQNSKVGAAFHRRLALIPIAKKDEERLSWKIKYMAHFIGLLHETARGLEADLIPEHSSNSFLRYMLSSNGVNIHEHA